MSKCYLSGAAKRKARKDRETEAAKIPKITAYMKSEDNPPENIAETEPRTEEAESKSGMNRMISHSS
jgi:hypothetical protein